ncbi:hypothetical protein NliqN6_5880 [Naganishia liquefaciens]|uniref:Uncharacterized protein n=1 Tax=Naganishia liquefaciens TaxID=104408 RepID=A0A8H3TZ40_9TREE|nr:hypothetical protein NliqN6_5880 [Naganishia liquefaciens]
MSHHPPSPPLTPAQAPHAYDRPPRSTVDSARKQELLTKLKAPVIGQASKPPIFKIPALPAAASTNRFSTHDDVRANSAALAVHINPSAVAQRAACISKTVQEVAANPTNFQSKAMTGAPLPGTVHPQSPLPRSTPKTSIPQISEDEAIAREFSYQTAEEIDLHKRVNKHVNGYLKKTCGVEGGAKAYTEAEASKVGSNHIMLIKGSYGRTKILAQITPLDLSMYPEVFEPAETDQLAKYLNQRRNLLEEFQRSLMPVPPLPLLPPSTSRASEVTTARERGQRFLEWGIQGVASRDRLVISKSDLQVIKAEVTSIRKAMAQAGLSRGSAAGCSLVATEKEESLLSRSSIRKAPRFPHQPSRNPASCEIESSQIGESRALKNSCKSFADVVQRFGMTAIPMAEQDDDPFKLFTRVKSMKTW